MMKSFPRRLASGVATSAILIGAAPALAAGADGASVFAPANIVGGILRMVVSYGRTIADIRYGAIEVDAARGAVLIRDLRIAGIGEDARCQISLGRLQLSGISFWASEEMRTRLDATDLNIANNCFGPNAPMIAMVTGGDSIPVQRLSLDMHQLTGSGAAQVDLEAVSPGIARIEGSADFAYVSMYVPDFFAQLAAQDAPADADLFAPDMGQGSTDPFDPDMGERGADPFAPGGNPFPDAPTTPRMGVRGELRAAHLSVENLGVWERLQPILPPEASNPQSVDALLTAEPGSALRAAQDGLAVALRGFLAQPGRVTAEIRPAAPVAFDSTVWEGPEDALTLFAPQFSNAVPTPPVALIADPSAAGDARSLGLALARGEGVPQNRRRAIGLLSPLKGDAEVSLVLAGMIAETDPAAAYEHAMIAAGLDAPEAPALLDRIEARLPGTALFAAQAPATAPLPDDSFASVQTLRDAALAREAGDGVARSYALAWRLAASAAAAGDGAAQALMARLNARFGTDSVWITTREAAADAALADWTGRGLGKRLAGQPG